VVDGAVEEKDAMSGKWKEKSRKRGAKKKRIADRRSGTSVEDEGPCRGMNEMKNRRKCASGCKENLRLT
jgi:hypothetical protein